MERYQRVLLSIAVLGWLGALRAQVRTVGAESDETKARRELTRNRFLLVASVAMNTLVASVIYRVVRRRWQRPEPARSGPARVESDAGAVGA